MAAKKNKSRKQVSKTPKAQFDALPVKDVRQKMDASSYEWESPVWQVGAIDSDGEWGWQRIGRIRWESEILPKLRNFETMTWSEIERQSGGKTRGTNHHPIPVSDLIPEAQRRLQELQLDDIDELFSLRLTGKARIFGIRRGRAMKILWFDFDHRICPSKKRRT